jgi:hypothetical protein
VDIRERKMSKGKTEVVTELALNFFYDWLNFGAKRTFVVSVLQKRNRRIDSALHVITRLIRQS